MNRLFGFVLTLAAAAVSSTAAPTDGVKTETTAPARRAGFTLVSDNVVFAPRNIPPIRNELAHSLIEIDGLPIIRETPPAGEDHYLCAVVKPGEHVFKVRVGNDPANEITFTATVESGKTYLVASQNSGSVALVEAREKSRQTN